MTDRVYLAAVSRQRLHPSSWSPWFEPTLDPDALRTGTAPTLLAPMAAVAASAAEEEVEAQAGARFPAPPRPK